MEPMVGGNGRARAYSDESDRPPMRMTTPAGMRLSVIMENSVEQKAKSKPLKPKSMYSGSVSKGSTLVDDPRESKEERVGGGMGYSYDIFAEKHDLPPPTLTRRLKTSNFIQRKGGWKRILVVLGIFVVFIIAIIVGIVVGVNVHNSSVDKNTSSPSSSATPAGAATPTAGTGSSPTSTNAPAGFPVGTYSFTTFLDTVGTNCTSDPDTWSCFPYTIYNDDHVKAMSTFNWVINNASGGSHSISSIQNPFGINFQNVAMKMIDQGGADERYQFQFQMQKNVVPSTPITSDGSTAQCWFNSTTMTGYLYTKRAKDYPTAQESSGNTTYQSWPYAVRVEQTAAGGDDVPNCYQLTDGTQGASVGNFTAEDATTLCSCLYRNYLTPT